MLATAEPERKKELDDRLLKVRDLQLRDSPAAERTKAAQALLDELIKAATARLEADKPAEAADYLRRAQLLAERNHSSRKAEIEDMLADAAAMQAVADKIRKAELLLSRDPKSQDAARTLLMLYLVEKDDPNKAKDFLTRAEPGEPVPTYLPLAAKAVQDLEQGVCVELGDWYLSLFAKASAVGRDLMLDRAEDYYEQFLKLHPQGDEKALAVRKKLEDIRAKRGADAAQPVGKRVHGHVAACAEGRGKLYIDGKQVLTAESGKGVANSPADIGRGSLLVVVLENPQDRKETGMALAFEAQGYAFASKTDRWKVLEDVKPDAAGAVTAAMVFKAAAKAAQGAVGTDDRREIARDMNADPQAVAAPKRSAACVLATVVEDADFTKIAVKPAATDPPAGGFNPPAPPRKTWIGSRIGGRGGRGGGRGKH